MTKEKTIQVTREGGLYLLANRLRGLPIMGSLVGNMFKDYNYIVSPTGNQIGPSTNPNDLRILVLDGDREGPISTSAYRELRGCLQNEIYRGVHPEKIKGDIGKLVALPYIVDEATLAADLDKLNMEKAA